MPSRTKVTDWAINRDRGTIELEFSEPLTIEPLQTTIAHIRKYHHFNRNPNNLFARIGGMVDGSTKYLLTKDGVSVMHFLRSGQEYMGEIELQPGSPGSKLVTCHLSASLIDKAFAEKLVIDVQNAIDYQPFDFGLDEARNGGNGIAKSTARKVKGAAKAVVTS